MYFEKNKVGIQGIRIFWKIKVDIFKIPRYTLKQVHGQLVEVHFNIIYCKKKNVKV